MDVYATVVHAEKFTSKRDQKVYTKLFVPVGFDVVAVIASGDLAALAGVSGVKFRLGSRNGELKLYYDSEEV